MAWSPVAKRNALLVAAVVLALALFLLPRNSTGWVLPVVAALVTATAVLLAAGTRPEGYANAAAPPPRGSTVALFKAGWCHYCKLLAPTWASFQQQAAGALAAAGVNAATYDVDAPADKPAFERYGVKKFPTILLLGPDGAQLAKFDGERTVAGLTAFATGGAA
jgi:thiol-disulfide isomerase/thioredoxin